MLNGFIPVDKSSAIRAFLFSLLTEENVTVFYEGDLPEDAVSALNCLKLFGKTAMLKGGCHIYGKAMCPKVPIECGNSATLMHLLMGIGVHFGWKLELTGDDSLMSRSNSDFLAAEKLYGHGFVETALARESAQLKSFHLLAMLKEGGLLHFKAHTRRNTEELLAKMGADIKESGNCIEVVPVSRLHGYSITLQKDPSAAFIALCLALVCGKNAVISGIYPEMLRMAPFFWLRKAGYLIEIKEETDGLTAIADQNCFGMAENDLVLEKGDIPALIDEIPFIAYMAARAGAKVSVKDAAWLRNKESDRIKETVARLAPFFETEETDDGFVVGRKKKAAQNIILPHSLDHRMEMLSVIIAEDNCIDFKMNDSYNISFPHFYELLDFLKNGQGN